MTQIGDVETRYLELALRLRRLEPFLVECYTGPGSLADAIESEPRPTVQALRQSVVELRDASIGANIAMLLDDGRSPDEMRSYARRWALEDDEFIDAFVESLVDDRWPAYESCYAESLPLCRRFVGGDLDRFGRLLREQLTPTDLDGGR